jgi:alanine racemase
MEIRNPRTLRLADPAPASAPGRLTIDLGALADNWRDLARRAAPGRCAAVVKANAYGTGVSEAAPALWAAGAPVFFVAHFSEGIAARRVLPAEAAIYVLNGLESGADPADYVEYRLAPAIGGEEELERWSAFAARRGETSPSALHLDTGMNRLGFGSLARLQSAMATHGPTSGADLLMSHFVSSEIPGDPINPAQIELFEAARAAFPGLRASLANSSGMFLDPTPIYDLGRPGYALYGGNPTTGRPNPMRPVVTLTAAIQQIRWIETGMTCGYNAQWTARRPTRLATLLIGYADGLPRGAGATDAKPGAEVAVVGRRAPLVGRVSMDLTIVDITDLPEDAVRPGDPVEFFGGAIDLDDFATRSGTIGYALLTGLGPRHQRNYVR